MPEELRAYEPTIIDIVSNCKIEKFVKQARNRRSRKLNTGVMWSKEFENFWDSIAKRTTYHVRLNREDIINKSVASIKKQPYIEPLRIEITRSGVRILRGGTKGEELGVRSAELSGSYDLPDIVSELQDATSLTRKTIIDILISSGRLQEFIQNPNDFIYMVKSCIKDKLAETVISGIQYEEISGQVYELRELQKDGNEEKDRFLDQLYEVKNKSKTIFDYVVYDSSVELDFAAKLDSHEDIKMFMKLPEKFRIPTPVGEYNPDWAIVKQEEGQDKIYMIRETKSTQQESLLRSSEQTKIDCGKKHFAAIGITDYDKSSPENWNI